MDSLRVLQCSTSAQYHYHLRKQLEFPLQCRSNFLKPRISHSFRNLGFLNRRILCGVSSVLTREEEKKMGTRTGSGKVKLSILLKHQVKFGEHVVMLGSTKELGSWKKNVPMNWTENGWVCKLELRGDESIEYKFVIVKRDKSMTWEGANNRVLKLPKEGSFGVVCLWNATGEAVDLLPLDSEKDEVEFDHMDEIGSADVDGASVLEVQTSPFVEQWQGRSVSFMRSNEHRNQETQRRWDTSGLEGFALKLVEGDRKARNWWQKLSPIPEKCHATSLEGLRSRKIKSNFL